MQDDEGEDNILESMNVKVIVPSSSKHKGWGDGSAIYTEVSGPVSNL
jgi:hypothetical protein